jgi:hypothetical protein
VQDNLPDDCAASVRDGTGGGGSGGAAPAPPPLSVRHILSPKLPPRRRGGVLVGDRGSDAALAQQRKAFVERLHSAVRGEDGGV